MKKYIIILQLENKKEIFWDYDRFFSIADAYERVKFFEKIYPHNIGLYKILEVIEK